ncbi:MAG: metalloregulator ArsR/SmtB family transcription factor [Planctomycetota bacterium]
MNGTTDVSTVVGTLADIGDPIRLRMLRVLESSELSVGEIARVLQIPQSTASRHLRTLANGSWIVSRPAGTATFYRMVADDVPPLSRSLWATIRGSLATLSGSEADDQRLADVIAQRSHDSMGFFGRVAGEWDAIRQELFGDRFLLHGLLALLPRHWTVADLGCGTGNVTSVLAPHVERVLAVDQSAPMLDAARRRLAIEHPGADGVQFIESSFSDTAISPETVDAAVISLVLHHVPDPATVFGFARRMLRTEHGGGVLLLIDMEPHERREYRESMGHAHLGFGRNTLRGLFTDNGFESPTITHIPGEPGSKGPGLFAAVARVEATSA